MSRAAQENLSLEWRMKSIPANPNLSALLCRFLRVQGSSASKGTGNGSLPAAQGLRASLIHNPQGQQCCQQSRGRRFMSRVVKILPDFRNRFFQRACRSVSARIAWTWEAQMRAGCDALAGAQTGRRACRVKYSRATERPGAPWLGSAAREAFSTVSACDRWDAHAELAAVHQHEGAFLLRQKGTVSKQAAWVAEDWVAEH